MLILLTMFILLYVDITNHVYITYVLTLLTMFILLYVTVPGKRDQLGNFFKIEVFLQQERVGFELQNALHI